MKIQLSLVLLGWILPHFLHANQLDIHFAVQQDEPKLILEAIANGEDIDKIGPGGQTPLMYSTLQGRANSVKFLLNNGADTGIGEKDGYTVFHGAGFQGRAEIAQMLLDHGLSPYEQHADGFAPWHRGCWGSSSRHTDFLRILLEAGVPFDLQAKNGKTCKDMTRNEETLKLLEEYESKRTGGRSGGAEL